MLMKAAVVGLLSAAIYYGGIFYYESSVFMGYHVHFYKHAPGPCRTLTQIPHGSEDLTLLPSGQVIISSGLRFLGLNALDVYKNRKGAIYLMDLSKPESDPVKFTIQGDIDLELFNPLGTAVWQGKGVLYLYVVNLRPTTSWVEKFIVNLKQTTLIHVASLEDVNFRYLNSLLPFAEDQFYFTNYQYIPDRSLFWAHYETYFRFKWGSVGFYDKGNSQIVADGILLANGITTSLDKKFVYVSNIGDRSVNVYSRNEDFSLEKIQEYPLYRAMDNLKTDPVTGDIWTGVHVIPHKTLAYMAFPETLHAPSSVLRMKTKDGLITDVTEVYADDGSEISGSTVAMYYKDHMLVGSIASSPILCKLKNYI